MSSPPPAAAVVKPKVPKFPNSRSTPAQFPPDVLLAWQVPFFALTGGVSSIPGGLYTAQLAKWQIHPRVEPKWLRSAARSFGLGGLRFGSFAATRIGIQVALGPAQSKPRKAMHATVAGLVAGGVEGLASGGVKGALTNGPQVGLTFGFFNAICSMSPIVPDKGPISASSATLYGILSGALAAVVLGAVDGKQLGMRARIAGGAASTGIAIGLQTLAVEAVMGC